MPNMHQMLATAARKLREQNHPAPEQGEDQPKKQPATLSSLTLYGLQLMDHVYAGTVPEDEVKRRRARNRHARRARRGNTAAIARQARLNRSRNRIRRFGYAYAMDPLGQHVVDAEVVDE